VNRRTKGLPSAGNTGSPTNRDDRGACAVFSIRCNAAYDPKRSQPGNLKARPIGHRDRDQRIARWGNWRLTRTWLEYRPEGAKHSQYDIDLTTCVNSAHILNWIAQLAGKEWIDSGDLGDLVRAFDNIFRLQGNVCGFGVDHRIDPREVLRCPRS
jgi:hypothetical protein